MNEQLLCIRCRKEPATIVSKSAATGIIVPLCERCYVALQINLKPKG